MKSGLRTVGVLLAGGVGQRVGLGTPKQLVRIAGRSIIEHTLALFNASPEIDEIIVLMTPGFTAEVGELVAARGFGKVSHVLEGGATRSETTWRALRALGDAECNVLLHDAVRPLLEPRIITECVEALKEASAVEVAIPSSDTIVVTAQGPGGEVVREVPDRSRLRRVQTPQGFRLSVIREAYERAFADPGFALRPATDDCGVVLRYLPEVPIVVVPGSERNIKVTHPVDVHIAERLFQLAASAAPLPSQDALREALDGRSVVVFGGGHGIGAAVAELARGHGAVVRSFSRSLDGVHVEDAASVAKALAEVGRVDFVVNAAEVLHVGRLAEASEAVVAGAVDVNVLGPVNVARAAHPYLRESGGALLFYTAPGPRRGQAGHGLYRATKAAVVELTRALADEWEGEGIRVNCVNPCRPGTPVGASGQEPHALPSPRAVAVTSVGVLASGLTGQVVDVLADDE
ncbi:bifunctional cytidylyltransferase/SDR family oxidoreductase [Nonomuraea dietziae]|uniref:bifunctional cytidylyltransferase/SDR family oxidoreductase n=1 Tax=Nonomuraea dietziae TaxID=65515 RepID=UPI0034202766